METDNLCPKIQTEESLLQSYEESLLQSYKDAKKALKDAHQRVEAFYKDDMFQEMFVNAICKQMDWKQSEVRLNYFGHDVMTGKMAADIQWAKDECARYIFNFKTDKYNKIIPVLRFREFML